MYANQNYKNSENKEYHPLQDDHFVGFKKSNLILKLYLHRTSLAQTDVEVIELCVNNFLNPRTTKANPEVSDIYNQR